MGGIRWAGILTGFLLSFISLSALRAWTLADHTKTPPPPAGMTDAPSAPTFASAQDLKRIAKVEGLIRLGLYEAAQREMPHLPLRGSLRQAATRLHAWLRHVQGDHGSVLELIPTSSPLSDELIYLRAMALVQSDQRAQGHELLRALWWRAPHEAWGLAALHGLAESKAPFLATQDQALILKHIHTPTIDTATREVNRATILKNLAKHVKNKSRLQAEVFHALGLEALRQEKFTDAQRWLGRAWRMTRTTSLRRIIELRLAQAQRHSGAYAKAMTTFKRIAKKQDGYGQQALHDAGQMAIAHRRYDEARTLFEQQLIANPVGEGRLDALWGLGWIAFRTGDNQGAVRFFESIVAAQPHGRLAPRASYWRARALFELGQIPRANEAFAQVVATFPVDYYAFMAQLRLRDLDQAPTGTLHQQDNDPTLRQLSALYESGLWERARGKLRALLSKTKTMGPQSLERAAKLGEILGLDEEAATFRSAKHYRFPQGRDGKKFHRQRFDQDYQNHIRKVAGAHRISPALVNAVIRQESGFNARAVSSAGALGLMQLMPQTATLLVQESNRHARPTTEDILKPARNIALGTRYLGRMVRSFDRKLSYALAAYNAGPGSVTRWRAARGFLPEDIFVEEIPYRETRHYVRRVLAGLQAFTFAHSKGPTSVVAQLPVAQ